MNSQDKISNTTINNLDNYIWCDFVLQFSKTFSSFSELKQEFLNKYPRVLAKIEYGSGYYLKKDTCEDLHSQVKSLDMKFSFNVDTIEKGKPVCVRKEITLENLRQDLIHTLPIYSKETFKPKNYKLKRAEFNSWTGFKAQDPFLQYDYNVVKPILNFIREVICNNDDVCYQYIVSWLVNIVQKPYQKTQVAVFLHSLQQGTGKGSFCYWLKNYLFGNHISAVVSGLNKLTQKHNTCVKNKIMVFVDELPTTSQEFHSQFDTMKHLITDPEICVEPKGVDAYEIPNMVNFMLMSNNLMALKLEKGDRRYACIEVGKSKKGDEEYWETIHDEVLTETTALHFFYYLNTFDIKKCVSLRNIPKTRLRERMIENSQPSHIKFFKEIACGDLTINPNLYIDTFTHNEETISNGLSRDTIYRLYENFCNNAGEKRLKKQLFFDAVTGCYIDFVRTKKIRYYVIKNLE